MGLFFAGGYSEQHLRSVSVDRFTDGCELACQKGDRHQEGCGKAICFPFKPTIHEVRFIRSLMERGR